jgi:hypothetical protein
VRGEAGIYSLSATKEKDQNCFIPLRSIAQFFQIIIAALFYAAANRLMQNKPAEAGTKKHGYAKGKTRHLSAQAEAQPCPPS